MDSYDPFFLLLFFLLSVWAILSLFTTLLGAS